MITAKKLSFLLKACLVNMSKSSFQGFFNKCEKNSSFLRTWSHLLKKKGKNCVLLNSVQERLLGYF